MKRILLFAMADQSKRLDWSPESTEVANNLRMPLSAIISRVRVLCWLLALCGLHARAVDYYIDQRNGAASDSNAGTSGSPWKTIGKANRTLVAGDTVYIKSGTYGETITPSNSGSPGKPITFQNYSNDLVTVTGATKAIVLYGKSYINVQGITFSKLKMFVDLETASHNTISYCNFAGDPGVWTGYWAGSVIYVNSQYNWVHHCVFSDFGLYTTDDVGCVLDIGDEESKIDHSDYNLIENNTFYHGGHHVLGLFSRFNVVRNNYFHNENWNNGYGDRCVYVNGYDEAGGRNLIEGNRIGYAGQPPDNTEACGMLLVTHSNIVRLNSIYMNGGSGIMMGITASYYTAPQFERIYNNVFYKNGQSTNPGSPTEELDGVGFANWGSTYSLTNNALLNNIFYKNPRAIATYRVNLSDQIILGNWQEAGDPMFVDVPTTLDPMNGNLPNFQLRTNSPCIDKGVFLTQITSASGSGTSFQVADPGYFMDGWGIVQGDLIQLQASTQRARITKVDYTTRVITVDSNLTWTANQGLALAYQGAAPDIGAYESGAGVLDTNLPPTVAASAPATVGFPTNTVSLRGAATDPNKDALSFAWSQVSGPGAASFSPQSASNTTATVSARGSYVFRLIASDGKSSGSADTSVNFAPDPSSLTFQAEAGVIAAPFVAQSGYITQSSQTSVTNGGRGAYTFTLTNAGSFTVSALVNAPNDSANSLFLNIDAEPLDPTSVWDVPLTSGFESRTASWRGVGGVTESPKVFSLVSGTHTLILRGREPGLQIDSLTINNVGSRPAAPANLRIISITE